MKTVAFGVHAIDVCEKCSGMWLDSHEVKGATDMFLTLNQSHQSEWLHLLNKNKASAPVHTDTSETKGIVCPNDAVLTKRVTYAGDSKITIDRCPLCHGIWFEGDELIKIAEYLKPDATDILGSFLLSEQREADQYIRSLRQLPFLPLKIVGYFSTPYALLAETIFFLLKYTDIDLKKEYRG